MTDGFSSWKDEFLTALATPAEEHRARAMMIKDEHIPNKLFRYRPNSDRDWENLRNGQMWMSAANEYNDPFDSGFTLDWNALQSDGIKKLIREATLPWLTDKLREELLTLPNPTLAYCELSISGGVEPTDAHRAAARATVDEVFGKYPRPDNPTPHFQTMLHVCSFAEHEASLLMWSHYARMHQGFCVEYAFDRLPKGDPQRNRLYPVIYDARRFDVTTFLSKAYAGGEELNTFFGVLACLHKAPEWAYEHEWRMIEFSQDITHKGRLEYLPTPSRIYLGARITPENEAKAIAICRDLGIPLSKMRLSDTEYKLESTDLS